MLFDNAGSYTPDMAELIDKEWEIIADDIGVSIAQALMIMKLRDDAVMRNQALILARVIGIMLQSSNMPVSVHALAIAAGLDQLNGAKSQAEIALELGCTRSLISHHVISYRDILSGKDSNFDCMKFRKSQASREVFKAKATDPVIAAKARIVAKMKAKTKI